MAIVSTDFSTTLQQMRDGTFDYARHHQVQQLQKMIRAIKSEQNYLGAEETKRRIAALVQMYRQLIAENNTPAHDEEGE